MKVPTYNMKNEVVGEMELPAKIFGASWKPELVKQVLLAIQANRRRPWAHAKDRSEVRGGGRKPWRQKGTGRARHGSTRSPLWIGGGKAHGPRNERDYTQKVNKKMRQGALASVLSRKLKDNEVRIFDEFATAEPKTKVLFGTMSALLSLPKRVKRIDAIIVPNKEDKNTFRAARNLVKAKAVRPEGLSVEDLMSYKSVFIDKGAVEAIGRHYKTLNPKP